jgi:hypothetical protein
MDTYIIFQVLIYNDDNDEKNPNNNDGDIKLFVTKVL